MNSERPLADVFFDYDESSIRADARGPLQANADWLKKWGSTLITIEGHCDSRGSSECNLALGARRSEAVKQPRESRVPANRVTIVSKERTAVLQRRGRVLLDAESPRTFPGHS